MSETEDLAVEIRLACPEDSTDISTILRESFAEYEPYYTEAAFEATTTSPDGVLKRMKEGPTWVAAQGGRIVGTVSILLTDKGVYIRGMAVPPAKRGRGVGRLLLEHIEAYASARQIRRLFLSTTPFLTEAISLYEHHGFRRTDDGPYDLLGTPLFTMEKRLGRADC